MQCSLRRLSCRKTKTENQAWADNRAVSQLTPSNVFAAWQAVKILTGRTFQRVISVTNRVQTGAEMPARINLRFLDFCKSVSFHLKQVSGLPNRYFGRLEFRTNVTNSGDTEVRNAGHLNWYSCLLCVCMTIIFSGCNNDDTKRVKLVLSGSSTVGPLVSEIGKRYEKANPDVRIDVQTGGSSRGIRDAKAGLADIGMSSRALKESEKVGRLEWPIAMDGVCFIIGGSNTVGELSESQLKQILRGEIKNWNELGGADAPVVFINRAAGRSELELVSGFFETEPSEMKADLIAGENQQGIKMVATTAGAISYMSVGASEEAIGLGSEIRMLPLKGVEATVKNVESGDFPLSRPLILVTSDKPSEATRQFIQYSQSQDVADLVRELSYVPIPN